MTDATPARVGQVNEAGDVEALFLKVFSGEVLKTFHETNVTQDKHMIRSITSGKSAQFPATGTVAASYHTAGAEIVGQTVKHNERVISIDDLLIAPVFIPLIDEAMNHFDVRSVYSEESGLALSETMDKQVLQQGYLAAAAAATITGGAGGTQVTDADADTNGSSLAGSLYDCLEALDDNKVRENDRFMFVKPAQYYLMVQTTDIINKDWGGAGAYSEGKVFRIGGAAIIKTTNLANGTNVSSGVLAGDGDTRHAVDATNYVALIMHKSAVGTVKLMNLATEMAYDIRRQGTLVVSKYAMGHGILRPESSCLVKTA